MNNPPWLFVSVLVPVAILHGVAVETAGMDTIFLRLYTGDTYEEYVDQKLENASLLVRQIDTERTTVFYIHGFTESVDSESSRTVIQAYLKRKGRNVIGVDYRDIAHGLYVTVAMKSDDVALAVAGALESMVDAGLKRERIHVVGHSLGGQVAGCVGRNLTFQLPRITALDPAGPFYNIVIKRVSDTDARFVDILHTDAGFFGQAQTTGHVDFFPNGGTRVQPGCPFLPTSINEEFCSHRRSWMFYAESVENENAFLAIPCRNILKFDLGLCGNDTIPMGLATPTDARGKYYLRTNSESPFGLGVDGLQP